MSATLPPAEPLKGPPAIMGPAVKIVGGPYNGMKGNVQKTCDTFASVVIDFEHRWFELITEIQWLTALDPAAAA